MQADDPPEEDQGKGHILAAVSLRLLDLYAEDGMTLEQLMAFTVSPDHERQELVWEALQRSCTKEPYQIRRLMTEGAVRASDKRARFVGAEAYEAAGGLILRDLFQPDDGGGGGPTKPQANQSASAPGPASREHAVTKRRTALHTDVSAGL